ncbi:hypothetical protein [Thalassolituus sp. C2-1]|uniref:hypothetical protein n=1 Tax=Venatorbacter sp. C2-1 TaxID=2597518 RepID=UPI00119782F4|nr:hypothetical protein [Thalassolituus sp. C2-1]TVV45495.1 hypothetical protein FOT50_01255 [Thalassolituus sp. C2-1]
MEIKEQFWALCDRVQIEDDKDYGITPEFGELLFEILDFVMSNPESEEIFKECFVELGLHPERYTEWILLYCMRDLRYPEVQMAINKNFDDLGGVNGAPRLMNFVSHVNWAYDNTPWEDADFFKYHWEKEHPGEPWPLEPKNA